MPILYEAVAAIGSYKAKDGTEKRKWLKVGAVFETKNGLRLKLDALPVNFDGWLMLSEPRDQAPAPSSGGNSDPNDSMPFAPFQAGFIA